MSEIKAKRAERSSAALPEGLKDREIMDLKTFRGIAKNDAPLMIVKRPKLSKGENGKWSEVINDKGEKVLGYTAFIPVEVAGKKKLVISGIWEYVSMMLELVDFENPDSVDEKKQETWWTAKDLIDDDLTTGYIDKDYGGEVHPVAVLVPIDEEE